ncbi:M20 family metallopeptidase [Kutzneria viridogrisea]|uniref:M20 family metallopeptidase n=1 Tax=Kutzneria TaxID=43356 RepID=UPI001F1BAC63|nr:M20 family metallopeptidase [Kutzneria albida]
MENMLADLAALVGVESPSADPAALARCAEVVADLGERLTGLAPQRVGPHLLWRYSARTEVLVLGHYDTVWPLGTLARWPFSVTEGVATGPGCFDMKAGLVQAFHALSTLDSLDGVAVLVTADEEIGSPGSRPLIEDTARGARAAFVLEASADGGALKTARKGTSIYHLEVQGLAAHAGLEPERGVNATIELAHQVLALSAIARPELGTTVTPSVASAGTTVNTVPAAARVSVDVRTSSLAEQRRVDEEIRSLCPVLPGALLRLDGGPNRPPLERSSSAALFELAQQVSATPLTEVAVGGASDGNFTAGVGVPTLDGLGAVGGGAHAEGEHVVVDRMPERAELLAALIRRVLT